MLSVVLWLVLCDEILQRSQHVWLVSVVVALDGTGQNAFSVTHEVCVVNVKGGELELAKAMYLRDIILIGCDCA